MRQFYVYIMASNSKVIYTGVTNDLIRRVHEHKQKVIPGFTKKYAVNTLVYYEETVDPTSAITREKQIKGWVGRKKIAIIESVNPEWDDLSKDWYGTEIDSSLRSE